MSIYSCKFWTVWMLKWWRNAMNGSLINVAALGQLLNWWVLWGFGHTLLSIFVCGISMSERTSFAPGNISMHITWLCNLLYTLYPVDVYTEMRLYQQDSSEQQSNSSIHLEKQPVLISFCTVWLHIPCNSSSSRCQSSFCYWSRIWNKYAIHMNRFGIWNPIIGTGITKAVPNQNTNSKHCEKSAAAF